MEHLTPYLVRGWHARTLNAAENLAVSDHVEACEPCRRTLSRGLDVDAMSDAVRADLELAQSALALAHPSSELLAAWADGGGDAWERERIDAHLDACASCREEAADLGAFAAAARGADGARRWRTAYRVAAAAAVVVMVVWVVGRWPAAPTSVEAPAPTPTTAARPAPSLAGSLLTTLRDGSLRLEIDERGEVRGLPAPWGAEAALLLRDPRPQPPAKWRQLQRAPDPERGASAEALPPVSLISPISSLSLVDRPEFRWRGPRRGTYRVEVYDRNFQRITASGVLTKSSWRPTEPLPRNEWMTWRVEATGADGTTVAYPRLPTPPAVFEITSEEAAARVAAARSTGSHLVAGIALWDAGLLDDAIREWKAFVDENPRSGIATELLARASAAAASGSPPGS